MLSLGSGNDTVELLLRKVRDEFERELQGGSHRTTEQVLHDYPQLAVSDEAVLELAYAEFVASERLGRSPERSRWIERFPTLRRDLEQLFDVHEQMSAADDWQSLHESAAVIAEKASPLDAFGDMIEIGRGGTAIVYRARQERLKRTVAVKLLVADVQSSPEKLLRFRREAEAAARLNHPNINQVFEFGEDDGRAFLVLEYANGGSLRDWLTHHRITQRSAVTLVEALARAIQSAHELGVLHRDVKPGNVLLQFADPPAAELQSVDDSFIDTAAPKLSDFGLAKIVGAEDPSSTRTDMVIGTPSYMAPEQAEGRHAAVGPWTDVYGLGTLLYELLTGRPPFQSGMYADVIRQVIESDPVRPDRLVAGLPTDLATICMQCLRKEPQERYLSADALAADLRAFLDGYPIRARDYTIWERTVKYVRRRPLVAGLLAALAGVICISLAVSLFQLRRTESALDDSRRANDALSVQLYLNRISLADKERTANQNSRALELLSECPEEQREWEWRYLSRKCRSDFRLFSGHQHPVRRVVWSPDGKWIASCEASDGRRPIGGIRLWNAESGQCRFVLAGEGDGVYSLAFDRTSTTLYSGHFDGSIRSWSTADGKPGHSFKAHRRAVRCLAVDPAGSRLVAGFSDGIAQAFRIPALTREGAFVGHNEAVAGASFSPDGARLVTCSTDKSVIVWDAAARTRVAKLPANAALTDVVATADGGRIFASGRDGRLYVWNALRLDLDPVVRHAEAGGLGCTATTPDARKVVWGGADGALRLDRISDLCPMQVFRSHEGAVNCVAVSPDGRRAASGGADHTVRVWNLDVAPNVEGRQFRVQRIVEVGLDREGRFIAITGTGWGMILWDLESLRQTHLSPIPGGSESVAMRHAVFAPRKNLLVGALADDSIQATIVESKRLEWTVRISANAVAASPDEQFLAAAGEEGLIHVLSLADGRSLRQFGDGVAPIVAAAFTRDGRSLATVDVRGVVRLWDFAAGRETSSFTYSRGGAVGRSLDRVRIAFNDNSRRIAIATPGRPLEVWNVPAGRLAITLPFRDGAHPAFACFDSTGDRLLAADAVPFVAIHDATTSETQPQQERPDAVLDFHRRETSESLHESAWFAVLHHTNFLIAAEPTDGEHYWHRGTARVSSGDPDGALQDLRLARTAVPGFADYFAALLCLQSGRIDEYRAHARSAIDECGEGIRPDPIRAALQACLVSPDCDVPTARLLETARRLAKRWPNSYENECLLGAALYRSAMYREAAAQLAACSRRRTDGGTPWLNAFRAMTEAKLGNRKTAAAFWARFEADRDSQNLEGRVSHKLLLAEGRPLIGGLPPK